MLWLFFWMMWAPLMLSVVLVFIDQLFSGFSFYGMSFVCSFTFTLLLLIPIGVFFPTIGVNEEYLRLYAPWGLHKTIPWGDIVEISRLITPRGARFILNSFMPKKTLFIKSESLGWMFKMFGFFYSNGGSGFIVHPKTKGYKEFVSLLKQYAPHAFLDK